MVSLLFAMQWDGLLNRTLEVASTKMELEVKQSKAFSSRWHIKLRSNLRYWRLVRGRVQHKKTLYKLLLLTLSRAQPFSYES
jgi:hypothetical protein